MDKNMNQFISIIIPVYNVADYLEQCIRSVVNQTYKNLEIFLIDDGSTDESGKICDEWRLKDSRVHVIHLPANIGLGNARNTGMKYAKGDFVIFVDSDDWLQTDACEKMLFRLQEGGCDACVCGYQCIREDGQIVGASSVNKKFYLGRELLEGMLSGSIPFSCTVWKFMFKREQLCDLLFDRDIYYEDVMFTTEFLLRNLKLAVELELLYHYRIRDTSITNQTLTDKHVNDLIKVSYSQAEIVRKQGYLDYVGRNYYLQILGLKYRIYQNGRNRKYLRKVKEALQRIPLNRKKLRLRDRIVIDVFQYAMPVYCVYRSWKEKTNRFL